MHLINLNTKQILDEPFKSEHTTNLNTHYKSEHTTILNAPYKSEHAH